MLKAVYDTNTDYLVTDNKQPFPFPDMQPDTLNDAAKSTIMKEE